MKNEKVNIFIVILLGLAVSGWGIVIYQKELQKKAEERIADVVWEQIEYRRQTEDAIRQDIETKKRAQAFINQLDYEKELDESINQKIADSENRQVQYYKQLENSFAEEIKSRKEFEDSLTKEIEGYKQKQQEYEQVLADYKDQLEEYNALLKNNSGLLEEYKNDAGEGLVSVRNDIARLEGKIDSQDNLISGYQAQLKEIHGRMRELEEKQKELDTGSGAE